MNRALKSFRLLPGYFILAIGLITGVHGAVERNPAATKTAIAVAYSALIDAGNRMMYDEEDYAKAEKFFAQAIVLQPTSAMAHYLHGDALYSLERYEEARAECRKSIELESENNVVFILLGNCCAALLQDGEAERAYRRAIELDPGDDSAYRAITRFYIRNKNERAAEEMIQQWSARSSDKAHVYALIGYCYLPDYAKALPWLRKAADRGDHSAANWMRWAYENGAGGVEADTGESWKWWRIANQNRYPWLARWKSGQKFAALGGGWLLVAVLLVAPFFISATVTQLGIYASRSSKAADTSMSWVERARIYYPLWVFLAMALLWLPLIYVFNIAFYPQLALPVSKVPLRWLAYGSGLAGAMWIGGIASAKARGYTFSFIDEIKSFIVFLVLWGGIPLVCIIGASNLPPESGPWLAFDCAAMALAILFLLRGGSMILLRWIGLAFAPDARVRAMVNAASERTGVPVRRCFIVDWRRQNAFALPFCGTVVFTKTLVDTLSDEELIVVCAHELGHLSEPWTSLALRLSPIFAFFAYIVASYFISMPSVWNGLLAYLLVIYLLLRFGRRNSRRMEERSDKMGKVAEKEPGTYARALEKIYRINLMPVVIGSKRMAHPDLYDRMVNAGVTPEYPKPEKPGKQGGQIFLGAVVLTVVLLAGLWLVLV